MEQEETLRGKSGGVLANVMRTLVKYGDAFGAGRLVPIKSAHLTGSFGMLPYTGYYDVLDKIADAGLKVKVPTTVNPRPGLDYSIVNRAAFAKQKRLEKAYAAIGVTPNYSCVCYLSHNVPSKGDILGWAESSAVVFANSVAGARTNRNSILVDVCGAVTGMVPEFGFLLDENRRGQVLIKLDINRMDPAALGFVIGGKIIDRVPVIEHHPFSMEDLKNLGGAMAASGGVALFHVEGLTPEAPDLKTIFDGNPVETITISQEDLDSVRSKKTDSANLVVFGCPQMTCEEATAIAEKFHRRHSRKPVMFCMVPEERRKFDSSPMGQAARDAGIKTYEHCPLAALTVRTGAKTVLTNSGKLYYYLSGTIFGTTDDCLEACGVRT